MLEILSGIGLFILSVFVPVGKRGREFGLEEYTGGMEKPRHPNVIRPWKVERIRKPGGVPKKTFRPAKKSK
jgi:hypothetical protein